MNPTPNKITNERSINNIMNDYIQIAREKTGYDITLYHIKNEAKGYTTKINDKTYHIFINMSMSTEEILVVLKHEIGHIIQESFRRSFLASLKKVMNEYLDKACSKIHPNSYIKTDEFACTHAGKAILNAHVSLFNIMEDVRMESRDGYGRIGRANGYIKVRKSMKGSTPKDHLNDPASKLLATRFFDNEILPEDEQDTYMNIHESLNMQSHKGMIKIFREFCKNYYHPYLDSMLDKLKSNNDKIAEYEKNLQDTRREELNQNAQVNQELGNIHNEFTEALSKCKNEDDINKLEQDRQMKSASIHSNYKKKSKSLKAKEYRNKRKIEDIQDNIENMFKDQKENINGGINSTMMQSISPSEAFEKDEIDSLDLNEEKQNVIKELNTKLENISTVKNDATEIDITNDRDLPHILNTEKVLPIKIRNEIRKTVDTVTNRKNRLMHSGNDVNLRAYLNSIQQRGTKIFNRKLNKIKLSILLSIDASGSMDNSMSGGSRKMDAVHAIVKTIMQSVKDKKEIEIKAMSWGGSESYGTHDEMGYTLIDNLSKMDRLVVYTKYEKTPTVQALRKSKTILHNMKGRKKIIIFLTDGDPSNIKISGIKTTQGETIQMCASEIKQIKTIGNIVPIFIGTDNSVMHKLFKNVINVDGDNMVDVLMRKFRKIIVDELR